MKISFAVRPVPPYRLDLTAWTLLRTPDNIIDRWDGKTYRRVMVVEGSPVEVAVTQQGAVNDPVLQIEIVGADPGRQAKRVVPGVLERLLGYQIDLDKFYDFAGRSPELELLSRRFRGMKPPRYETVFEAVVNAIACQQITLKQGIRLLGRLAERYGPCYEGPSGKAYGFPRPEDLVGVVDGELRPLGFSRQKSAAITGLARDIVEGRLDLNDLNSLSDEQALARLEEIRGVGRWTAEYVLLRGMGRLNIFPGDDVGARNHLQSWLNIPKLANYPAVMQAIEPWKLYGGLVYLHLLLERLKEEGLISA